LPTFDGKFAEYKNFINSFTQIIAHEVAAQLKGTSIKRNQGVSNNRRKLSQGSAAAL